MRKILLLTLLLAACEGKLGYEQGEPAAPVPLKGEWRRYGVMADFEVRVNIDSIVKEGPKNGTAYTYVWMLQDFNEDQVDGVSKGKFRKKYTRQAIDCPSARMAGVEVALHDENDAEVARYAMAGYQRDWESPAPNTFGADFVKQICKLMAEKNGRDEKTK